MSLEPWIEHDKRQGKYFLRWRDRNGKKHSDEYRYEKYNDAKTRRKTVRQLLVNASLGKADLTKKASELAETYFDYFENRCSSIIVVRTGIRKLLESQDIVTIGDITRQKLVDYHEFLYDEGLSKWTILRYMGNVRAWLNWCVENEWLVTSPFTKIKLKAATAVDRYYTDQELIDLERAIEDESYLCLFRLGYMCGLRPGEMLRIEPSHILWDEHLRKGELAVPRDETKSNTGRIVPLPQEVYGLLHGLGEHPFKKWGRLPIIRYFWKVKAKAGIKDKVVAGHLVTKTLYWTRHTYAKRYLENGGTLAVLKDRMGHASITLTSDTYGHLERSTIKDIQVPSIYKNGESGPASALQ